MSTAVAMQGVLEGYGVVDVMRGTAESSRLRSTCSFASWSDEE
jgi:hypothetical protein